MSVFENLPPDVKARIEAATEWRQRLKQNPVLELSPEYLEWISVPANCRAFNAVEEALDALDEVAAAPELLEMRKMALHNAQGAMRRPRWLSARTITRVAAVLLILAAGSTWLAYNHFQDMGAFSTAVGERRIVPLPDGSRISLDSDSAIHVHYTDNARAITLDKGRARFDVAHDVTRPFSVTAGTQTVVAVGTSFDVERIGPKVVVTLIQGHVVIKDDALHNDTPYVVKRPTVSLSAGEELVAVADLKPEVSQANLQTANAWESGKLVFRDESLAEAVERVNRYTDKPISVAPDVADIRINGVFNAGDVGSFVSGVTSYFPVQATTDANNAIVLERKS